MNLALLAVTEGAASTVSELMVQERREGYRLGWVSAFVVIAITMALMSAIRGTFTFDVRPFWYALIVAAVLNTAMWFVF